MRLFKKNNVALEDLIDGCVRNDRRSQKRLYERYFNLALRIVGRYTRDKEVQLHIINEGFLRIFTKIDKYRGTGSFEGWMSKLIFHEVSNHFRKRRNNFKFIEVDPDKTHPVRNDGLLNLEYKDIETEIWALPESSRQVFILFALEGFSHNEIGDQLGISEGTSKWHVSNARKILKQRLMKRKIISGN